MNTAVQASLAGAPTWFYWFLGVYVGGAAIALVYNFVAAERLFAMHKAGVITIDELDRRMPYRLLIVAGAWPLLPVILLFWGGWKALEWLLVRHYRKPAASL